MQSTIPARQFKMERLIEVSRMLNNSLDLEPFLQYLVDVARELTLSEAASISLYEEETGLLKFVAAPHVQREALQRVRIPLENSAAGTAYTQGRAVIIQDASNDPLIYRRVDELLNFQTRSLAAVPIYFSQHTLGVIEAVNKLGDGEYTQEDILILENLAAYAGVALFNAALLEESRIAQQEIEELERLKSDFIAITSHELRTPLGLVLGHAAILKEALSDGQYKEQLEVIIRSAGRIQKLLDDLASVDLPRNGRVKVRRQTVSLRDLLKEVCSGFEAAAKKKGVVMILKVPEEELSVAGDAEKLALAVGNLVDNAIHFTHAGGHVVVLGEKLAGFVKVSVLDDGVGIPARDLPRVFDRFFQVERHATRRHGGLGLGLSVAKVMVEMHGGQIWAESIEGRGSKFSILLPSERKGGMTAPPGG